MHNTFTQGNFSGEVTQMSPMSEDVISSRTHEAPDVDKAYSHLTKYEKSRHFNELSLESLVHKKLPNTVQAGFECSSFVQELVASHAEDEQWQSRRKEFFRSNRARSLDNESNKLKHFQSRNVLMTLVDRVVWNSSQAIKRLFAA